MSNSRYRTRVNGYTAAVLFIAVLLVPYDGSAQAPFYQGKTVTIVHGRDAGGSGDLRVRAVAPFLQKYIPGNPTIVHEYMDGGGGRKAANHIYGVARGDGLTIGNVGGGVIASAVLGEIGVSYDLDKLPFIGSPYSTTHYILLTRREAGLAASTSCVLQPACVSARNRSATQTTTSAASWRGSWVSKTSAMSPAFLIPERDVALMRGEIDAITASDDLWSGAPIGWRRA